MVRFKQMTFLHDEHFEVLMIMGRAILHWMVAGSLALRNAAGRPLLGFKGNSVPYLNEDFERVRYCLRPRC